MNDYIVVFLTLSLFVIFYLVVKALKQMSIIQKQSINIINEHYINTIHEIRHQATFRDLNMEKKRKPGRPKKIHEEKTP